MTTPVISAGKKMRHFSVIIIGAGPGGLACARLLARHGLEVLVVERREVVGPKVCGGGITRAGMICRLPLQLLEKSFAAQYVFSPLQSIKVSSPEPIVSTINRARLGEWMLRQATEAGAVVRSAAMVTEITDRYVTVVAGGGKERTEQRFGYRYLVGADGSTSLLRRYLKLRTRRLGVGIHCQVGGDFENMEWHFDPSLFGSGYGWIFPHRKMASVGVYAERANMSPQLLLHSLRGWAAARNIDLTGLRPRAGLVNFDYQGWRFGNKLLVGDAAGLASGLTGEGIYPAIISGEVAARTIIDPRHQPVALDRIIAKQQKHQRILDISGKNSKLCRLTMEMLILGLRTGLVPFSALEMAD